MPRSDHTQKAGGGTIADQARNTQREQLLSIAQAYFDYMAAAYPVMCLSDEFYFFPRAQKSLDLGGRLDSLDEEKIGQDTSYVKRLRHSLEKIIASASDPDVQADATLLRQSIAAYTTMFEEIKIWQHDPSIYLKIILLGIDHLAGKLPSCGIDAEEHIISKLIQAPYLLGQAKRNLTDVPASYLEVSLEIVEAAQHYLQSRLPRDTREAAKKTQTSLEDFTQFLKNKTPAHREPAADRSYLENILKESLSVTRSPEEIFTIAVDEYHRTLKGMERLARAARPGKPWRQIITEHKVHAKDQQALLRLYEEQIGKLRKFIRGKNAMTVPETARINVLPTPGFMQPIRASASYSAPITSDPENAFFYITAPAKPKGHMPRNAVTGVHNEYIFVTAHETYPGHHLLDAVRRGMRNPIRRQIESPLFYEGWASYAERLIDRLGYVAQPAQKIIGLRRQAWRAVRAMVDVGTRIDKLSVEQGGEYLKQLGYAPRLVTAMLRRYALSPGYQSCYAIGKFEIDRLRKTFVPRLGLKRFHDMLLQGGQIPFPVAEKQMERATCRKRS